MIEQACPVIVLDDDRNELWNVSHGLGFCGFPVMPHLVRDGKLERVPASPYSGVRLLFTDLHLLGPTQSKPEQYIGALIAFIQKLIAPSTYVVVFWSNYVEEAEEAWKVLDARIKPEMRPLTYKALPKDLAKAACDEDDTVSSKAREELSRKVGELIASLPHLRALMTWEASVSTAASKTTNDLLQLLPRGGASLANPNHVRDVLARMAQEALGYPYGPTAATKGLTQALLPIVQDCLERRASEKSELANFLSIKDDKKIGLPGGQLHALLNDFFIHAEGDVSSALDRGAVVRFDNAYLEDLNGFTRDVGPNAPVPDWRQALCGEFYVSWNTLSDENKKREIKEALNPDYVFAIELSALCDHAQNKPRTQRFLLGTFIPAETKGFIGKEGRLANESIYATPEITIGGIKGRLLISCRIFISRPYGGTVTGAAVTRLRKEVVDELSHHYATHMRRPGKVAFYG